MASGALFGSSTARGQSKNLVEFRAGKMTMKGKMVHPDKRKGLVYVHQSDDSLIHFCWKERGTGTVEDDLIIFPDDCEFKHVPQCTTGRVYVLKFKNNTSRKLFFWLQEPKSDKDEDNCKKVNEYINNPPTPGSSRSGGGGGGFASELGSALGESDIQSFLGGMNQQQLMQLLGGMGGLQALGGPSSTSLTSSTSAAARSGSTTSTAASQSVSNASTTQVGATEEAATKPPSDGAAAIQLGDLQDILAGIPVPQGESTKSDVDLTSSFTADNLTPIINNPAFQNQLMQLMPEGAEVPHTPEELRATIQSPQFQQALGTFTAGLQSGQLGPLMSEFELGETVVTAAAQGDVEKFVHALQAALNEEKKQSAEGETSKKEDAEEDDDEMALD